MASEGGATSHKRKIPGEEDDNKSLAPTHAFGNTHGSSEVAPMGAMNLPDTIRHAQMSLQSVGDSSNAVEAMKELGSKMRTIDNHWPFCQVCKLPPALKSQQVMHDAHVEQDFPHGNDKVKSESLGGWLRCTECTAALHFKCLVKHRQTSILEDINADRAGEARKGLKPPPLTELPTDMVREDIPCMTCYEEPALCYICGLDPVGRTSQEADEKWGEESDDDVSELGDYARPVFRCRQCIRFAHYECLASAYEGKSGSEVAASFRAHLLEHWNCPDCARWPKLERILAWRKLKPKEAEKVRKMNHGKDRETLELLTREYLVKFVNESWRDVAWVPHSWLERVNAALLKKFRNEGPMFYPDKTWYVPAIREWTAAQYQSIASADHWELIDHDLSRPWVKYVPLLKGPSHIHASDGPGDAGRAKRPPDPEPKADMLIPASWREPERILDVFYRPSVLQSTKLSDMGVRLTESQLAVLRKRPCGLPPRSINGLIHIAQLDGTQLLSPPEAEITMAHVAWVLVKWAGLGYEEASWTQVTLSSLDDVPYSQMLLHAYFDHLTSRDVLIRKSDTQTMPAYFDPGTDFSLLKDASGGRELAEYQKMALRLMIRFHDAKRPFLLADDSGLGKAVEIISLISYLFCYREDTPVLLLVPPHTIPHWTRLLRTWLPAANTVPFYGTVEARRVVEQYELFHTNSSGIGTIPGLSEQKAEIIVADLNEKSLIRGFANRGTRWELLVAHLFVFYNQDVAAEVNKLNTACRVVLTDTPLPDSPLILGNVLDYVRGKTGSGGELRTNNSGKALSNFVQAKLSSFWIRRHRADMPTAENRVTELTLSTALKRAQKVAYKGVLKTRFESIKQLCSSQARNDPANTSRALLIILLDLLRVCQNAFLCGSKEANPDHIPNPTIDQLLEGSAKLILLRELLSNLRSRGHCTVVVTPLAMNLDVIEELVIEDRHEYIRVDRTSGLRDVDMAQRAWNQNGAPYSVALLHSRVCSSDLNLLAADTVILFGQDVAPDVNWHNVGYVWRFGQKKPLLILNLITHSSAESYIHGRVQMMLREKSVVQNVNAFALDELEKALKNGQKDLWEEGRLEEQPTDISYSSAEVAQLLDLRGKVKTNDDLPDSFSDRVTAVIHAQSVLRSPGHSDQAQADQAVPTDTAD